MPEKEEQFTTQEEIKVELTVPLAQPTETLTTEREAPIKRNGPSAQPILRETHGMTTEANRFKET
jgi:hypothetical protein